ncbi:retrovirus-related pol polyprotein from transposon TNT 1-94 [Tanacetum coccineum]
MLYIRGKENGEMLKGSVINGPYKFKSEITTKDTYGVTDIRREERLEDLKGDDKLCYDSDIKAVNILLLGLLVDIYTLINHYQTAKEIWDRIKELMEESIHSYYLRYAKLINDMNMISMSMTPMQINMKFVNHLQPEWSRFVTAAKQARDLHSSPPLQSYAPPVVQRPPTFQPDTGLAIPTFLPTDDPIASYAGNARNNQALGERVINAVGNTTANQPRVIRCYNCKGEGHMAKQCTARKRVKNYEWFKDKMLLAQAQEARVVLDEEQQDFLADSLEETDDCEDLQLQATTNFKTDHIDAYDSDCDDEATTNAIFMAKFSPIGSLNDDTVAPHYDSDTLFEVPHYDTYHDSDMLNSNIQELGYIENIVSTNESYDELKSNSDVISYTDYMLTIRDDAYNYVPPPVQKDDMMLSVIEQIKSQVEKCTKVNQELKSKIERVRVLGYVVKDGHSEQEAYRNRELYTVINDRNRKRNFETLKQESFEKYEKNISEIVDLENAKKKLENIVLKLVNLFKLCTC